MPKVVIAVLMKVACVVFKETDSLFSRMAVPFYISPNNVSDSAFASSSAFGVVTVLVLVILIGV